MAVAVQGVPVLSTRAGRVKFKQAVSTDQKWFYNRAGPCTEMRAFSGLRWKTHVLDGASEIAKRRNCSESRQAAVPAGLTPALSPVRVLRPVAWACPRGMRPQWRCPGSRIEY